jgi:UDP-N-acetylmuramate dehydrogenase
MVDDALYSWLKGNQIAYIEDVQLQYNSYSKTGGLLKLLVVPQTIEFLIETIKYLRDHKTDYKVIGKTTNIIFLDCVEYSIFISTEFLNNIRFDENIIEVSAGKSIEDFIKILHMKSIKGFEGLEGIPGSIGGAIFMNAGSYGCEISDNLLEVKVFDENSRVKVLRKSECKFSYRNSIFRTNKKLTILSVKFKIEYGDREEIYRATEKYHIARHSYQEFVYPNLGSIFSSNVYKGLIGNNVKLKIYMKIVSLLFYNRIARFIKRKRPNSKIKRNIILKKKDLYDCAKYLSIKNINTFINCNFPSNEILECIVKLRETSTIPLIIENEICLSSVDNVINEQQYSRAREIKENLEVVR